MSFEDLREEILTEYLVEDSLLLYKGRLCIRYYIVLYTRLIQEVYA